MSNQDASITVLRYNTISTNLEYAEGLNWYPVPAHSSGVSSLNTLTGAVTLSAGSNITLTPSGNNIAISSSGGGTPGGTNGKIQYNHLGAFGGDTSSTDGAGNLSATSYTATGDFISTASGSFVSQSDGSTTGSFGLQDLSGTQVNITAPDTFTNPYAIKIPQNYGPGPLIGVGAGQTQLFFTTVATMAGTGTVSPGDTSGVLQYNSTVTGDLTINGPTPVYDGQKLVFRITNDGSHSVTFATGAGNFAFGATIPSYTNSVSLTDYIGVIWSIDAGVWHIVSLSQGF